MEEYFEKKTEKIQLRLTSFEKKLLKIKAEESGLTLSEFVLSSALNRQIKPPMTSEELESYKTLKQYQTNFARISNLIKGKENGLNEEIEHTIKLINIHLKNIVNGK